MALKFLNKKGWHTGSLRNIENVWKAEQKHDAEEKKLDELRKQIHEERERSEFRQLQVEAGLVPRQERLDFLYESGLAVGKSSDGFKALEVPTEAAVGMAPAEAVSSKAAVPGALFEDKPQSSNDAWRKLHSDPLLLIRQREQAALARIKNNPIQMSMIRKSVEAENNRSKDDKGKREKKKHKRKHHHKMKKEKDSDSEKTGESEYDRRKNKHSKRKDLSKESSDDEEERRKRDRLASDQHNNGRDSQHAKRSSRIHSNSRYPSESEEDMRNHSKKKHSSKDSIEDKEKRRDGLRHQNRSPRIRADSGYEERRSKEVHVQNQQGRGYKRPPKMTEEEREARLREMQVDAELHEEQRWKRIKNAAEADAREAARGRSAGAGGKNFLDAAQKSIFGAEKGGSSTIEESVRRRAYYSQGGSAAHESNAFRR